MSHRLCSSCLFYALVTNSVPGPSSISNAPGLVLPGPGVGPAGFWPGGFEGWVRALRGPVQGESDSRGFGEAVPRVAFHS